MLARFAGGRGPHSPAAEHLENLNTRRSGSKTGSDARNLHDWHSNALGSAGPFQRGFEHLFERLRIVMSCSVLDLERSGQHFRTFVDSAQTVIVRDPHIVVKGRIGRFVAHSVHGAADVTALLEGHRENGDACVLRTLARARQQQSIIRNVALRGENLLPGYQPVIAIPYSLGFGCKDIGTARWLGITERACRLAARKTRQYFLLGPLGPKMNDQIAKHFSGGQHHLRPSVCDKHVVRRRSVECIATAPEAFGPIREKQAFSSKGSMKLRIVPVARLESPTLQFGRDVLLEDLLDDLSC